MSALSIGVSALQVSQQLIDLTGQNIANANTPGYHRQVASLAGIETGNNTGSGVTILSIDRQRNDLLDTAVLNNTYEAQNVSTQLNALQQVEAYIAPGAGGIDSLLSNFFNQVQTLAASPADQAQRSVVVNTASNLADTLNSTSNQLLTMNENLNQTGADLVDNINNDAQQIASLNSQIETATASGQKPNDLLDQRDQVISNLSQLIDVRVIPTNLNQVTVMSAGAPIVAGTQSLNLQYQVGANDQAVLVRADKSSEGLVVTGGQAAGLLQVRNGDLSQVSSQLDTLTAALVQGVDEAQATGIALTGPLTSASGSRGVSGPTVPLSQAGLAFPPTAGTLAISVTQTTGANAGTRTLYQVPIDPTTMSLNDVATAISAVPNLTASVNPASNTLQVTAANGYAFDFAGQIPSAPTNVQGNPGNIAFQVSGSYTGTTNDTYTFKVSGSGTVGVTAGLTLQAFDGNNDLLGSFNIGQGYQAGTVLSAVNGVTASVGAGTLAGTESFQVPVTANPDTGNLLTGLGLNTLFTGSSAATLGIRSDLLAHPELLSGSRNGDTGDGSNFTKIANLQNAQTLANGTQSVGQYFAATVGDVGVRVQDLTNQQTAQQTLGQQLSSQQQSVSGVDTNEELTNLLQYQRSFQMASEYINVVNQTLTTLMGIIPVSSTG
ncbi:MAG TPA: flagellar hook-associated protein FlgK [Gemmataceae bacterium]|nr:flagellar hook-associated protein FlgK [Gemmataceae bacterium]